MSKYLHRFDLVVVCQKKGCEGRPRYILAMAEPEDFDTVEVTCAQFCEKCTIEMEALFDVCELEDAQGGPV